MTSLARTLVRIRIMLRPNVMSTRIVDDKLGDPPYSEILRELALRRMIDRGLVDADQRRMIPTRGTLKEHSMSSVKETITRIVDDQPDDASYDEILRELALRRMIDRGLADSDAGRTIRDQELRRRIGTWQR